MESASGTRTLTGRIEHLIARDERVLLVPANGSATFNARSYFAGQRSSRREIRLVGKADSAGTTTVEIFNPSSQRWVRVDAPAGAGPFETPFMSAGGVVGQNGEIKLRLTARKALTIDDLAWETRPS